MFFTVFFHGEISVQIFLMRILRTSGRNGGVVANNKTNCVQRGVRLGLIKQKTSDESVLTVYYR